MEDDMLSTHVQEKEMEIKLLKEKCDSYATALIEERKRSEHYMKLAVEKNLASSVQPDQTLKENSSRDDRDKVLKPASTDGEADVETDGEALTGRSSFLYHSGGALTKCRQGVCDTDHCKVASIPGSDDRKSRLETDDVQMHGWAAFPSVEESPTIVPFSMSSRSGMSKKPTSAITTECRSSNKRETVELEPAATTAAATAAPLESKACPHKFQVDGKLLAEVKDAVIGVTDTEKNEESMLPVVRFPDVSHDLLNKVMQQNARLKKLLRQIVDTQGISVQQFLDLSDSVEVTERLKIELATLKSRVTEQQQLLKADDNELREKCSMLLDKVHRLEQAAVVQRMLVEAYTAECDKLQRKVKRLGQQLASKHDSSVAGDGQQFENSTDFEKNQLTGKDTDQAAAVEKQGDAELSRTTDVQQQYVEMFCKLSSKYSEMENVYRKKLQDAEDQLMAKTHTEDELRKQNENLKRECEQVWQQLNKLLEEKHKFAQMASDTATKLYTRQNTLPCSVAESRLNPTARSFHLPCEGLVVDSAEESESDSWRAPPTRSEKRIESSPPSQTSTKSPDEAGSGTSYEANIGKPYAAGIDTSEAKAGSEALGGAGEVEDSKFVCKRCEKTFTDSNLYKKHCSKCIDE